MCGSRRIAARERWSASARLLALLLPLAVLAGCSHVSETANTRIGDRDMRNRVELVRIVQPVRAEEAAGVDGPARRFLDEIGFGYGDRLALVTGAAFPSTARAGLERLVRAYGGRLVAAPPLSRRPKPDEALLVVERYRVTSPPCPEKRLNMSHNHGNAPAPQFGCANLINLGQMVADAGHLLAGAPAGANDSERATAAIEAWRAIPPVILMPSDTKQQQVTGGGGG